MKRTIFFLLIAVLAGTLLFYNCKKKEYARLNPLDPLYSGAIAETNAETPPAGPTYHAGVLSFNDTKYKGTNAIATLTLSDADLTGASVIINVKSSSADPLGINLALNGGAGNYTGNLAFTTNTSVSNSKIKVRDGDIITASYTDAAPAAIRTDTATWTFSTQQFLIYSDAGLGTGVNPPERYGSPDNGSQSVLSEISGGCSEDPSKTWHYTYTNKAGGWSGWYDQFGSNKDLSSYTYLKLWVKGDAGGEKFEVFIEDSIPWPDPCNKQVITATTSWSQVIIPLTFFGAAEDLTDIKIPYNIAFSSGITGANATVSLDYIRFE